MRGENCVGHSRCVYRRFHVVRSQDMSTFQNQGRVGGKIAKQAISYGRIFTIFRQHPAKK